MEPTYKLQVRGVRPSDNPEFSHETDWTDVPAHDGYASVAHYLAGYTALDESTEWRTEIRAVKLGNVADQQLVAHIQLQRRLYVPDGIARTLWDRPLTNPVTDEEWDAAMTAANE